MPTIGPDPEPLKETITYTGENRLEVADWAYRTLDHYELPNDAVAIHNREGQNPSINGVVLAPGTVLTFNDKAMKFTHASAAEQWMDVNGPVTPDRQFDQGPEILAQDHPLTVAEAGMIRGAAADLGVNAPSTYADAFAQRRAEQLFPLPVGLQASIARHPSAHVPTTQPLLVDNIRAFQQPGKGGRT